MRIGPPSASTFNLIVKNVNSDITHKGVQVCGFSCEFIRGGNADPADLLINGWLELSREGRFHWLGIHARVA